MKLAAGLANFGRDNRLRAVSSVVKRDTNAHA